MDQDSADGDLDLKPERVEGRRLGRGGESKRHARSDDAERELEQTMAICVHGLP
ncbi:MAG TPA: hypothetical protein VGF81_05630 [Solirubrobacteraceae bacterium]|jgi:hypothetical protein